MFNPFKWRFAAQDAPPETKATDSYFEKLLRYIPADLVAGYLAITGIMTGHSDLPWLPWGVFFVMLGLTPLYVCYLKTDPPGFAACKTFHWVVSCIAFTSWSFALGGPFATTFTWYQPYLGSVVLILTTLIIPVLEGQFVAPPNVPPASPPSSPHSSPPAPAPEPTPTPTPASASTPASIDLSEPK